jgi:hypothetical protein
MDPHAENAYGAADITIMNDGHGAVRVTPVHTSHEAVPFLHERQIAGASAGPKDRTNPSEAGRAGSPSHAPGTSRASR